MMMMMMMMMVLCPKAGSVAFMPPGDEMREVVSRCLPHRQLWVSILSKVATQWLELDSNPRPFGCKSRHIPTHTPTPPRSICLYTTDSHRTPIRRLLPIGRQSCHIERL